MTRLEDGQVAGPVLDHGGSLARASALFPGAPKPWIDLSTGINPHSYPLFDLPQTAFTRLPEPARIAQLAAVAARTYGAPSAANVAPAPGTQILLPLVAKLVRPGRAMILSPTYAEHARAAAWAGHNIVETGRFDDLFGADVAIVVNPNNPDGRIVPRPALLDLATALARKGGLLVADEAFMEVGPREESLAGDVERGGSVVLKSFGKFFGLAGVRLGFAIASQPLASRLAAELGPWAVAGPALEYGLRALADNNWQEAMRCRLAKEAEALDALLARHGITVAGGTPLFRYVEDGRAASIFQHLGRAGLLVRNFERLPGRLRFGLPGGSMETKRLDGALTGWAERRDEAP
jgi:cobalamin biosynthetic protein CobC